MLNTMQAMAARFLGRPRYGASAQSDASQLDVAVANNYQEVARHTSDYDVEVWRLDTANRLRLGGAFYNPTRKPINFNIALNASLAASLAQSFFIAGDDMDITDFLEIHAAAGTDSGAVTITITKETGTQSPGTGTALFSSVLSLKATANTFQIATLAYNYTRKKPGTDGNPISLKAGDRLSILIAGAVTTLAGLCLTAYAQPGLIQPHISYAMHANANIATQYIGVFNEPRTITAIKVVYGTKSSGANVLDITKESSTTAPGAGTSVLASTIALNGANNTVISASLSATASVLAIAPGDRLSVKFATTTALADILVMVYFAPIGYRALDAMLAIGPNGLQGTDQDFFIADRLYEILDSSEVHGTAAGSACKGLITIDKTTAAPGAGTATQTDNSSTGFDLNGTANTVQVSTAGSRRNRLLQRGERLGIKHSASAASLANMVIGVTLRPM